MMTTSAATLDLERLLSPISADNPCGESLQFDPVLDELSQLRKSRKDPLDSSADKLPEWGKVIDVATEALATRTKDLWVAGRLTEALVRRKSGGFDGFRDGLRLIHGLVDRFWKDLHPLPEDQDLSKRADRIDFLTSKDGGARMPAALREIRLVPQSDDGPTLNWNFWHLRRVVPQGKDEKEDLFKRRSAEAEQKRQLFDAAVDASPITFYQTLLADMDACLAEIDSLAVLLNPSLFGLLASDITEAQTMITLNGIVEFPRTEQFTIEIDSEKMTATADGNTLTVKRGVDETRAKPHVAGAKVLDQRLGDQSPSWEELQKSIGEIRVFVYGVLKRRGGLVEAVAAPQVEEGAVTTNPVGGPAVNTGPIRSRDEAIARLEEGARFFSQTEPHSPVAYLVRRAVRWAGMPFEEVLGELVKDDKLVKQIGETLGIVSSPPAK